MIAAQLDGRVTSLWRHPIKAHGVEAVEASEFVAHETMPWDRRWAIAHEASKVKAGAPIGWAHCANFSRGAKSPSLMAIRVRTDEASGRLSLSHPNAEAISVDPDDPEDARRLIDWVLPLSNPERALPRAVVRTRDVGLTDSAFPSIAILNRASLAAVSEIAGQELAEERFRGNIWFEGLVPWSEFELVGREIRIGTTVFLVREPISRCMAIASNPDTGRIDIDMLGLLESGWGHQEFGVYAEVMQGGRVAVGDSMSLVA